jgi:hypothetical protein
LSLSIIGRELLDFKNSTLGSEIVKNTGSIDKFFNAYDKIPELSKTNTLYTVRMNARVSFSISNEKADAGQSFVPYFDGSEVSFNIKSPLSGLTFVHYTNDESYAGYVKPVISSLDYRKYYNMSYQPEEFVKVDYSKLWSSQKNMDRRFVTQPSWATRFIQKIL